MSPRKTVTALIDALFVSYDCDAAEALLAPNYTQHSAHIATGKQATLGLIPKCKHSGVIYDVSRMIAEDNLVVVHGTYSNPKALGGEAVVAFDVYRVEDDKVTEHWDNRKALVPPNPSGRSMTDGMTEIVDQCKTAANKALVTDFIHAVLHTAETSKICEFISPHQYLQHNPNISDGVENLASVLEKLEPPYDATHFVVAEGNFVFAASEGMLRGSRTAYFDLFRVDNNQIVEHWDVMDTIGGCAQRAS